MGLSDRVSGTLRNIARGMGFGEPNPTQEYKHPDGSIRFFANPVDPNDKTLVVTGITKEVEGIRGPQTIGLKITLKELEKYEANPQILAERMQNWDMSDNLRNGFENHMGHFLQTAREVYERGVAKTRSRMRTSGLHKILVILLL